MFSIRSPLGSFSAESGEILSDVLSQNGIFLPRPCGGAGRCGKCTVFVNSRPERACCYKIHSDIDVVFPESILSSLNTPAGVTEKPGTNFPDRTDRNFFALDLGTTSLVLVLADKNGSITDTLSRRNPQTAFGSDVMSRISFCASGRAKTLQNVTADEINSMLNLLLTRNALDKVNTLYVSGNTVMLHIFFSQSCLGLGTSPYTPVFLSSMRESAEKIGLCGVGRVVSLPCISAFVGADITAGLNCLKSPESGKYTLFADIGTNAEICLVSDNKIVCTSAAAGPCFEGANIECGCSLRPGAVYACSASGEIKTVDSLPANGICGTGLIDIAAMLLKNNIVDMSGSSRIDKYFVSDGVYVSAADIRELQTAKSAVCSGICTLMKECGARNEDIGNFYITGGFSHGINIENAAYIGLFPWELTPVCSVLPNACIRGTVKYAAEKSDLSAMVKKAGYIDLAANDGFSRLFIKNLQFGCVDMN